ARSRPGWQSAAVAAAATARGTARGRPGPTSGLVDLVLDEQHFQHLVLPLAARRADLDGVAHLAADQAPGDGAGDADPALLQIRLGLADDHVLGLLAGFRVLEADGGAEHHALSGQARD